MVGPDDPTGTYVSAKFHIYRAIAGRTGHTIVVVDHAAVGTTDTVTYYNEPELDIDELRRIMAPLRALTKALNWIPNQREAHGGLPPPLPVPLPPLSRPVKLLDVRRIIRNLYTKRITAHGP